MQTDSQQPETVAKPEAQGTLAALTGYPPEHRDKYVDFKGWRMRAPWRCMCCGKMISLKQFCFGRACGACDCGKCVGHQQNWRHPYSGPRELIDAKAENFIEAEVWSNPPEGLATHPDDKDFPKHEEMMNRLVAQWDKEREQRKADNGEASHARPVAHDCKPKP